MADSLSARNFMLELVESLPVHQRGELLEGIALEDLFFYFIYSRKLRDQILIHRLPENSVKISLLFDLKQCVLLAQGPTTHFFLRFARFKKKEINEYKWKNIFIRTVCCMTSPIEGTQGYHVWVKDEMLKKVFLELLETLKLIFNTNSVIVEFKFLKITSCHDQTLMGSMAASRENVVTMLDYYLRQPSPRFNRFDNPDFVQLADQTKFCFYTHFNASFAQIRHFLANYIQIGNSINKVIGMGVRTDHAKIRVLSYILQVIPGPALSAEWKDDMFVQTFRRYDGVIVKFGNMHVPLDANGEPLSNQTYFYVLVGSVQNSSDMVHSLIERKLYEIWENSSNKWL